MTRTTQAPWRIGATALAYATETRLAPHSCLMAPVATASGSSPHKAGPTMHVTTAAAEKISDATPSPRKHVPRQMRHNSVGAILLY